MPRGMTNFNTGARAQYTYDFNGYQGARNPFTQLAQVFNSGTMAEQSATLQARHALLMGAVDNANHLSRYQGQSDIDFADFKRRGKHGTKSVRNQQHYNEQHFAHLGLAVTGVDKNGVPTQTPTVSNSLQQDSAHKWYDKFGIFPTTSATPSYSQNPSTTSTSGAQGTFTINGGYNPPTGSASAPAARPHPGRPPMPTNPFPPALPGSGGKNIPKLSGTQFPQFSDIEALPQGNTAGAPDTGSDSKRPMDALKGRPEHSDSTIEPPATHISDFTDRPIDAGTAGLAEEHSDTATSKINPVLQEGSGGKPASGAKPRRGSVSTVFQQPGEETNDGSNGAGKK
jgi:hypothetical protein